jgi:tetratricopeptide (TPR) repeat protein
MKLFTTTEVAKILSLPRSRVHSFVRAGFISPARDRRKQLQFTFQDLLLLKTAKALLESRVASKKIMRMLNSLKRQLPADDHLSRIKIYADGERIVALDGKSRWQPDSGQCVFNFDAQTLVRRVKMPRPAAEPKDKEASAREWFERALQLEPVSVKEAARAYHAALELDPRMADAHLNLGRLCLYHDAKQWDKAEEHYRAAAECAGNDPAPLFNLAVLMEDRKRPEEAIRVYRRALERDHSFADAHYNLGLLLESLGWAGKPRPSLTSAPPVKFICAAKHILQCDLNGNQFMCAAVLRTDVCLYKGRD